MVTTTGNASADAGAEFTYYDDGLGLTFSFNPFSLEAQVVSSDRMDIPTSDFRAGLVAEMDKYCAEAFRVGKARHAVH